MQDLVTRGDERGVAEADQAGVGEDLDEHPAVKGEVAHGGFAKADQVHRVGAEVRRQRNGLAFPLDDAGADFCDLHDWLSICWRSGVLSG